MQPLILTNIGLAKLASATPEDQLEIKHIAIGDGGGGYPPIDPTMTALVNEVWRGDSSAPIRDPESNRVLIFETIIPNNEGGFTIREVGLFDVDGDMIAIGQIDEIEKTDGSPGTTPVMLTLRVRLTLENASQTDLIIADSPLIDHQGTSNRDAADAHPIEAITGLVDALNAKANTADLGTAAYKDVVSDEDDTTPGQLITTEWRGLNLTKRWQLPPGNAGWYKFATVNGIVGHGAFFIDRLALSSSRQLSARIEFSGTAPVGVIYARSLVSGYIGTAGGFATYGSIAYHHTGSEIYDLYVYLDASASAPVVEFIGSPYSLINTDTMPAVGSLPSGAVEVPRSIDWNSQSMDQSWQDVTAIRALSTTYTNTTGRPIHVSVNLNPDTGATSPYAALNVDGNPIAQGKASVESGQVYLNVYSIVPPGSTYGVVSSTGTGAAVIRWWREYR